MRLGVDWEAKGCVSKGGVHWGGHVCFGWTYLVLTRQPKVSWLALEKLALTDW